MIFATAATSGAEGRPARGFVRRGRMPIDGATIARSGPGSLRGPVAPPEPVAPPGPVAMPGRVAPSRPGALYGFVAGEHLPIPGLRDFECREPEGDPYVVDRMPSTSAPPAAHRHPRANGAIAIEAPAAGTPAIPAPGVGPIPGPPRAYPVESAFLQADRIALSLRGALERTGIPLARTATALVAAKAWCDIGYARLDDYARERLGRSGRWVRDLAALGERLRSLPGLAAAITGEDGGRPIGRVAAMLIVKVATPSSLDGWIATARAASIRALREAVRAARAAPPGEPAAPEAETQADAGAPSGAASSDPPSGAPSGAALSDPAAAATQPPPAAALDDDDDAADRLLVRMMVPSPILAVFDEAVDLYRAVEGGEATVASFVEALLAEAAARGAGDAAAMSGPGATPAMGDADMRALHAGPAIAALERALAASTENWRHLPEHAESAWALSLAGVTLARFHALAEEAGRGDAVVLDRQLRALVDIENDLEARLGGLLADLGDRRAWPRLRFAGVGHYGEERLGLSRTTAEDRARLARDLRQYPRLREAYAAGLLGRETAALVARLLRDAPSDPAREAAWVQRAAASTVKRMRDEARALGRYRVLGRPAGGGEAAAPADPAAPVHRGAPAPLDDASWHASLRREPGLARRRVRLFGRMAFASPDVFQALPHESDAFLRLRLPLDLGRRFLAAVDAERRRLAAAADALPWDAEAEAPADADLPGDSGAPAGPYATCDPDAPADSAGPAQSWLAARMFSIRCRRLPAWVGLLALIEDFTDTWDNEDAMPRRPGDEIYIRDGWRCTAPGCTSRRNLEDHHLRYRSRGGDDDLANRICLCRFHHQRGEHGGLASCRGKAPTGVLWRLGRRDAAPAWYRNELRVPQ